MKDEEIDVASTLATKTNGETLQTRVAAISLRAVARVLMAVAFGRHILVGRAKDENSSIITTRVALPIVITQGFLTSGHHFQHAPSFKPTGLGVFHETNLLSQDACTSCI